jgi:hypothetical protein
MSDFDVLYPPKGKLTFDGGQNTKYERSLIPDNESPACFNVVFSNGAVGTRGGSTKLNTTAVGSFAVDGLYTRRDITGAETMVAFAGGTAWALTGATTFTTIASAQSVFTAGVRVGTAQYENHMFIGNGYVTPYKYNGTAFTRHGVPAPSSGLTGAVSATGGTFPAATFYYKVTYLNSQTVQGDVSTISTAFAVGANGSVELSGIPVAPQSHGVNSRRIFRASGAAGTFQLIATIANNTTTTFSDTYFPASTDAPTDQGEPPRYSVIVYHQGRLWCNDLANPNFVWYSEVLEPYTFKATNFRPLGNASFDLVKGLEVYQNGVLVLCERGDFLIQTPSADPADWRDIKIPTAYGSKSPFGCFNYNGKLMFPAMENDKFVGFAAVAGSTLDPQATDLDVTLAGSDLKSDRIEPEMFDVVETAVGNISSICFKNRAFIALTQGSGNTANNRVFLFDYSASNLKKRQEASWAPLKGLNISQFTVFNGRLYGGSSLADGFIHQIDTTSYADNATAIDSYFWTKEFAGVEGHEDFDKDFRFATLLVEMAGAYQMTLNWRVDSDNGEGTSRTIDLDPGGSTWGDLVWGVGNWDAGKGQMQVRIPLGPARGKRIQFKFSNQNALNQRFKVHWMTFTYNLKGKR